MSDENATLDNEQLPQPSANQMVRRGFQGMELAGENAATQALVAKATADIQARWVIAMRRPRNMDDVRQLLLHECKRPKFAKAAIYALPRGSKTIRGLTIRFAEAAAAAMGNMSVESQTLYDDHTQRVIRVTVTNLEGNTTWSTDQTVYKTKEVKQLGRGQRAISSRANSFGDVVHLVDATDDDVAMKQASLISKASRTGILRMIPASLVSECFDRCDATAADADAKDPDGEKKRIMDAFADHNVQPSWLVEWLGHPLEQVTPAEIKELRQLLVAIREGEATLAEAMTVADDRRARAKKAQAEAKPATPAQPPPQGQAAPATNGGGTKPDATPPAQNGKPTEPAADRKVGGKGAQAVKDKVAASKAETPATPPASQDSGKTATVQQPELKLVPSDATELRDCVLCGGPIECLKADPPGVQCDACRNS